MMRRRLLIGCIYGTLLSLGVYLSFYQYTLAKVADLFSLNGTMMGVAIGVQSAGMAIPPLVLGGLSGKIGKNKVIVIAYGLMLAGSLLSGAARSFLQFLSGSFLIGAGFSVLEATLSAVLADEFAARAVRHLNYSQAVFSIGALIGPILSSALLRSHVGFQRIYLALSGLFFLLGGLYFLIQRGEREEARENARITQQFMRFFRNRVLLLLALLICIYVGVESSAASFTEPYFRAGIERSRYGAVALSAFWGCMIPSRYLAGTLKLRVKTMMRVSCSIAFAGLLAAMLVSNPIGKLVLFAVCGFGCGPVWPLLMHGAACANRGSSGLTMNIMLSFCSLGGALLPLLAGAISDVFDVSGVYYCCAVAMAALLLLYGRLDRAEITAP